MDYQSLVETKLEPVSESSKDIVYRCPICDDKSGHLYVDYNKEMWHCFKCNAGGKSISSLLRLLNINADFDYEKLYSEVDKELDNIISPMKIEKKEIVDYSTNLISLTTYYDLHSAPLSRVAYGYLLDRGLSPEKIYKLGIREGISRYGETFEIGGVSYIGRDYSGRILVPSLRKDGLISFYVARDYIGDKKPKYLNPPKELAKASEDVYNLDIVDSDSVIICEGVFTAIAASPYKMNAVATYGKSISQKSSDDKVQVTSQGEKLLNRRFKNYFVCYDADALEEAIKSCEYLYDRGANVYLVLIDPAIYGAKADVADIGYEEFMKLMKNAIHYQGGISRLTF